MNKRLIAIAIAAGLASPFAAYAADVSIYGVAHVSMNQIDVGTTDGELDLTSNKSHIGFKGSQDLGDGLSAFFKASWQVDYTDNTTELSAQATPSTKPDTDLLVYDRWVGLKGGFGSIKFGTMASNYKQTGKIVDPFWATRAQMRDTGLQSPGLMNGMGVDRSRVTDAAQYTSNNINNMTFVLNTTFDGSGDNNTGFGVRYKANNIHAFFDYIKIDTVTTTPSINTGESGMKVGGAYTMGATTVALGIEMTEDLLNNDYNQFSVTHKLNEKGTVALSYGQASAVAANSDKSGFVLGYKHKLGKNTTAYAAYLDQSNDNAATELSGFSLGLAYKF
ncbi:MAG: porin [Gammaproteobacteria bacterium]|nr:porin [Gammaproteobacteria bacterium]